MRFRPQRVASDKYQNTDWSLQKHAHALVVSQSCRARAQLFSSFSFNHYVFRYESIYFTVCRHSFTVLVFSFILSFSTLHSFCDTAALFYLCSCEYTTNSNYCFSIDC